ncbi:MAG TPA: hypothetical protein PK447_07030 [Ignavibacteria bacterium]|nr:hypothetical protein [Ignavibacteria bacterium]
MKLINSVFIVLALVLLYSAISYAQGFTPPSVILGIEGRGCFAMHDAYGTNFNELNTIGMMWGRGVEINGKLGLGVKKNHRITLGASYDKFINSSSAAKSFFTQNPRAGEQTNFNIWSGYLGYEYCFSARCRTKQYIGGGVSGHLINAQPGAFDFDDAYRVGFFLDGGYELVLDPNFKTGIFIGFKYNLLIVFGTQHDTERKLNDGANTSGQTYGPDFWRRIGSLTLTLGFNFYLGTKMVKPR